MVHSFYKLYKVSQNYTKRSRTRQYFFQQSTKLYQNNFFKLYKHNFTTLYKTLTQLYKTFTILQKSKLHKQKTIHNFTQHNLTTNIQIFKIFKNYTRLYIIVHSNTQLNKTIQNYTKPYKTEQHSTQHSTLLQD